MRPIKLTISGINSFKQQEVLDFTQLNSNLFCIYGDTGAGKTTLLDAIILALYGEYSRSRGIDFLNLESEVAQVEFEFAMEGNQYRVYREFSRDKKGEPKKKVRLYKNDNLLATQLSEVNEILLKLIGINKTDFTQVVALEQGKFNTFLSSTRQQRTLVVCKLFHLEKYKDMYFKVAKKYEETGHKINCIDMSILPYENLTDELFIQLGTQNKELEAEQQENDKKLVEASQENSRLTKLKETYEKSIKARAQKIKLDAEIKQHQTSRAELKNSVLVVEKNLLAATEVREKTALELERLKNLLPRLSELKKCQQSLIDTRAKYKKAANEKQKLNDNQKSTAAQRQTLETRLQALKEDILKYIIFTDFAEVKAQAQASVTEFNRLTTQLQELQKDKENAQKAESSHIEQHNNYNRSKVEFSERLGLEKKEQGELKKQYDDFLAAQAALRVRQGLTKGDKCPVCGGVYLNAADESQALPVSTQQLDQQESLVKGLEDKIIKIDSLIKLKTQDIQTEGKRIKEMEIKITLCVQELDKLKIKDSKEAEHLISITTEANNSYRLATDLLTAEKLILGEIKTVESSLLQLKSSGDELKQRQEVLLQEINKIGGTDAENRHKQLQIKLEELINSERIAKKNKQEAESSLNKETLMQAEKQKELSIIIKDITDVQFNPQLAAAAQQSYDTALAQKGKLAEQKGILKQKLEQCKDGLEHKKKAAKELSTLNKLLDNLDLLKNIFRGDTLLQFIADEYIAAFTLDASVILNDISGGKYSLYYEAGAGEFYVLDYLNGGKKRKVGTLSGGETFLASLALATAIARHISQKSYDFFFLDEGFGTLDSRRLDMVTEALIQLSRSTMVGVISHRSELVERLSARVRIEPANENLGSRIVLER